MIKLTARIVAKYLAGNALGAADLPNLIRTVHQALVDADQKPTAAETPVPAVPIKKSVAAGHVVCLDCGKILKTLRHHISADHGLTPDEYRAKWGLPADHPLVAPDYAEKRSALARKAGLGSKRKTSETAAPAGDNQDAASQEDTPAATEAAKPWHRYLTNRWAKTTG